MGLISILWLIINGLPGKEKSKTKGGYTPRDYLKLGIILNFILLQIPMQDKHLSKKYGREFTEYAKNTKKIIPFIY